MTSNFPEERPTPEGDEPLRPGDAASDDEGGGARPERAGEESFEELPPKRRRFVRALRVVAYLFVALLLTSALTLFLVVRHYSLGLPSVETLKGGYDPPQITRIYAKDETLLGSVFTERRTVVPFDQIPDAAKLAFLAAEDAHFYEHEGLNYFGILRALIANVRAGHMVQGGSTITQQVIKNVLLDAERTFERKVREVLLVRRLEQSLTKDEIFWLYLNHIYLGHGRYGIEEASRYYFGKPAKSLALDEAATLAGLTAAPERYSPRKNPERALARRRYVLEQMLRKRFVTEELHAAVVNTPLRLAPAEEAESRLAPEMIDYARSVLSEAVPAATASGGFSIHTTIDPRLQAAARKAVRNAIDAYMKRQQIEAPYTAPSRSLWPPPLVGMPKPYRVYTGIVEGADDQAGTIDVKVGEVTGRVTLSLESRYNPKHLSPSEFARPGAVLRVSLPEALDGDGKPALRLELGPQGALVALDARTREVRALVGSYEGVSGGLDRATRAKRQPGSSFKALLYSYALHSRRFTPATPLPAETRGHGVPAEGPLELSLRDAVAHSNNDAARFVMREVGPEAVVDWSRALGIESRLEPDLSLALGSYELSVLELTNAYVTFANGGNAGVPRFVTRVAGPDQRDIALPPRPPERNVMSPDEAYLTTSLLRSVIETGTARAAKSLEREVAGKTGTTNDSKDAWFVGYSTDIVVGVWIGYDDAIGLGKSEFGARTALPAWIEVMKAAHESLPKTAFSRTKGVLRVKVDPRTGLLPSPNGESITEEFLAGTEPTRVTPYDAGAPAPGVQPAREPDAGVPEPPELPPF